MNLKSQRALHIFLASVFLLIGCDVSTFTSPQQIPTPIPGAINLMAAQTAAAAATETAALLPPTLTPTLTPFPTQTPPDTPTVTPTFVFFLVTPTSTSGGTFACYLISQVPQGGANFHTNQTFTAQWQLSNSGSAGWPQDSVTLKYVDGQQFSSTTVVDLPKTIVPGDSVTLTIDMTTPSKTGKYTADWTLADGSQTFCPLFLRITVK